MSTVSSDSNNLSTPPSDALIQLLAPDGYYTYLGITKRPVSHKKDEKEQHHLFGGPSTVVDEELVKKNYRKLSLKHHPDKRGGDVETFRLLNRAQRVLLNPVLREQYDIVGIDLDDDDDEEHAAANEQDDGGTSTAQGIVQEIAGMVMASLIHLGVRTVMMGGVSVVLVRYRWTLYPTLAFLSYIAIQLFQRSRAGGSFMDMIPPLLIATGLVLMHKGRRQTVDGKESWTWMFWSGEALVIFMFTYNSLAPKSAMFMIPVAVLAMLVALWFRGNIYNYLAVIALEAFLSLLVAMAFPVMELVLQAILNEKLQKVGDKVRAHHVVLEKYYRMKRNNER